MMVNIDDLYQVFLKHSVVTTDSRNCPQGSIFFALKGDKFNGNLYAESALDQGCAFAVVDEPVGENDHRVLRVDHVLNALQQLAAHHRRVLGIPIIGITGTNGKTTTKELVAAVLKSKYQITYTLGNLNNHIGVPLTILSMNASTQIGVVEMGANHIGEIAALCQISQPDYGLITNIGKAHIEGFGSYEGVIQAKSELYQYIRENKGKLFLNSGDPVLMKASAGNESYTYSLDNADAEVYAIDIVQNPFLSVTWGGESVNASVIQTNLIGAYNAINVLAAVRIGLHFGLSPDEIRAAVEAYKPENNRSQLVVTARNKVLMDAYNANPSSLDVALSNFETMNHPNKIAIIGSMKELGAISESEHEVIGRKLLKMDLKQVLLVGPEFEKAAGLLNIKHFVDTQQLIDYLKDKPVSDSLVLVKGSRGNQLEKLLPFL